MIHTIKTFFIFQAIGITTVAGMLIASGIEIYGQQQQGEFQDTFNLGNCNFASSGSNRYFILEPGHQSVLEAQEDGEMIEVVITVLNETKVVDGIETRIVEERESEAGELVEISRNYFAICKPANDIFYFGEDVDIYEGGEIVSHEGAWLAGENNTRAGLFIPGNIQVGMKYYQEIAPGIAEDRAEIVSVNDTLTVPAGNFTQVLRVEETNPLEPDEREDNFYAPGVGVIQDDTEKLVKYTPP
jgi:hypothetical protein